MFQKQLDCSDVHFDALWRLSPLRSWLLSMASNMAAAGMGDSCEITS